MLHGQQFFDKLILSEEMESEIHIRHFAMISIISYFKGKEGRVSFIGHVE